MPTTMSLIWPARRETRAAASGIHWLGAAPDIASVSPGTRLTEELAMTDRYSTLRVTPDGEGVLSVVIDAPPMNLIGPELVRDLVGLIGALESGQETRVVV